MKYEDFPTNDFVDATNHIKFDGPVIIEWLDSKGVTNVWEFKEDIEPLLPSKCTTVGFIVDITKDFITVTQSISEEQIIGRMTIPICSITSIDKLTIK